MHYISREALVTTETRRTPFERINIDILVISNRNHILMIRDEVTKFSQAYALSDKTVVNIRLLYFQYYTSLRIYCDYS